MAAIFAFMRFDGFLAASSMAFVAKLAMTLAAGNCSPEEEDGKGLVVTFRTGGDRAGREAERAGRGLGRGRAAAAPDERSVDDAGRRRGVTYFPS